MYSGIERQTIFTLSDTSHSMEADGEDGSWSHHLSLQTFVLEVGSTGGDVMEIFRHGYMKIWRMTTVTDPDAMGHNVQPHLCPFYMVGCFPL